MKRRNITLKDNKIEINSNFIIPQEIFIIWLYYSPNPQFITLFLRVSKNFKTWIEDFISMKKKIELYQPDFKWIDELLQNMKNQSFDYNKAHKYNGLRDLIVFYKDDDDDVVSFAHAMKKIDHSDTSIDRWCSKFTLIDNMKKKSILKYSDEILYGILFHSW
jgi:hypothetical protein